MKSDVSFVCVVLVAGAMLAGCNGGDAATPPAPVTYSVAGTVSGLSGTGLVLSNNGATLPVTGSGTFTLGGSFNAGSSYAVTVSTQPTAPAQVCTVSNGSGVINANVSNISITCATSPMTVASSTPADGATNIARDIQPAMTFSVPINASTLAGHVSFRRGSRAVTATIAASGATVTATPQRQLSLLTNYTLAVDTGLQGTHGETTADTVTRSFTTRDGTWHPVAMVRAGAQNPQSPTVATLANGTSIATWYEYNGSFANIWANIYSVSQGWSTPVLLDTTTTGDAVHPVIVADANGNAIVAWEQSNGTRWDVFAARYVAGSGWSTAFQVNPPNLGTANQMPQVAVNLDGDAMFVWVNTTSQDDSVWARLLPAGGTLGTATRIETATGNANYPKVVMDAGGNATAVWMNYDNVNNTLDLWSNRYSGGAWGTSAVIDASPQGLSEYSLALDNLGGALAVWSQQVTNSTQSVFVRRFTPGTGWGSIATLTTTTNGSTYYPEVAADPEGNAMVQWGEFVGPQIREFFSYIPVGGSASAPAQIGASAIAKMAFDASGNALAIWDEEVGNHRDVKAARFVAPATWSTPVTVLVGGTESAPQLALDSFGNAIAVWAYYDSNANAYSILSSRFDDTPVIQ
jgi:hypothetical protein